MASISSLSSINGLNLWLDATDLSTIVTSVGGIDVRQWNDKSSNAYNFIPLRQTDPPKISTNGISSVAVLFDQVSSFQLISKTKIPVTSSIDFFAVLTPYSLWGPRQPIFDSADMTVSETDGRINTQIYADGNEFFRSVSLQTFSQGCTLFQGSLYLGSYSNQSPNYLQRYNRNLRGFEYFPPPLSNYSIRSLSVYRGSIFASAANTWEYFMPTSTITSFISTNFLSTNTGPMVVYNRQLYSLPTNAWENYFNQNASTRYPPGYSNMLYQWYPSINRFSTILNVSSNFSNANSNRDLNTYNSNLLIYRGDMYMTINNNSYGSQLFRYNDTNIKFINNNLAGGVIGYTGIYYGSLILPYNSQKLYRWNENTVQMFARMNFNQSGYSGPQGGLCTYKGQLFIMKNANPDVIEAVSGFSAGGVFNNSAVYEITTNNNIPYGNNTSNLMIVHDGKLFFQGNQCNIIYEYGNGVSLDQSFSTFVGAPILLNIRKSGGMSQMFLNGTLLQTEYTHFTFSNQPAREMFIGGGAGTMASGTSDVGTDHLQGSIHTIAQYNHILSTSERQKVEGLLAWKYGIQNVLPASHPYATSRP
jgi:hypothetical protein